MTRSIVVPNVEKGVSILNEKLWGFALYVGVQTILSMLRARIVWVTLGIVTAAAGNTVELAAGNTVELPPQKKQRKTELFRATYFVRI